MTITLPIWAVVLGALLLLVAGALFGEAWSAILRAQAARLDEMDDLDDVEAAATLERTWLLRPRTNAPRPDTLMWVPGLDGPWPVWGNAEPPNWHRREYPIWTVRGLVNRVDLHFSHDRYDRVAEALGRRERRFTAVSGRHRAADVDNTTPIVEGTPAPAPDPVVPDVQEQDDHQAFERGIASVLAAAGHLAGVR